jgi:prolyl 4-hydroxylase
MEMRYKDSTYSLHLQSDESHTVIHGRPFALKGRYYANIFVHFEPFGYTTRHVEKGSYGATLDDEELEDLENVYKAAEEEFDEEVDGEYNTPDYVHEEKEAAWRQAYVYDPDTKVPKDDEEKTTTHTQEVRKLTPHTAAALGRLDVLKELMTADPSNLTKQDANGWRPIHEAARSGEIEVLKFLVEHGADVNERTNEGAGGTPLFWAEQMLPKDSEAVLFLKAQGAKNIPPMPKGRPKDSEL